MTEIDEFTEALFDAFAETRVGLTVTDQQWVGPLSEFDVKVAVLAVARVALERAAVSPTRAPTPA